MQVKQPNPAERRVSRERRKWRCQHDFPYVDGHGILVTEERRTNAGRRATDNDISGVKTRT